eukprot:SAG25_NODE_8091_length_440_cov_1.809384_1_plen_106_part_10
MDTSLSPKELDVQRMLACEVHIGTRNVDYQMERYVWRRRADGAPLRGSTPCSQACLHGCGPAPPLPPSPRAALPTTCHPLASAAHCALTARLVRGQVSTSSTSAKR